MLKPSDLAFETSDFLLLLLNRVKGPFEPAHPAGEGLLFGLESCPASQQLRLSRALVGHGAGGRKSRRRGWLMSGALLQPLWLPLPGRKTRQSAARPSAGQEPSQ